MLDDYWISIFHEPPFIWHLCEGAWVLEYKLILSVQKHKGRLEEEKREGMTEKKDGDKKEKRNGGGGEREGGDKG